MHENSKIQTVVTRYSGTTVEGLKVKLKEYLAQEVCLLRP
jgi:hypothetical protein